MLLRMTHSRNRHTPANIDDTHNKNPSRYNSIYGESVLDQMHSAQRDPFVSYFSVATQPNALSASSHACGCFSHAYSHSKSALVSRASAASQKNPFWRVRQNVQTRMSLARTQISPSCSAFSLSSCARESVRWLDWATIHSSAAPAGVTNIPVRVRNTETNKFIRNLSRCDCLRVCVCACVRVSVRTQETHLVRCEATRRQHHRACVNKV